MHDIRAPRRFALALAFTFPVLLAVPAHAAWVRVPLPPGYATQAAPDGSGGAIVAWLGSSGACAQHVLASDDVDPGWPAGGVTVGPAPVDGMTMVSDGSGGAIVIWD